MIALAQEFVCAADEVWRLQRGSDDDCVFFQRMVNGGERIVDRGTRQGVYVCSAGGRLLARANTRNIEHLLEVLEGGRAAWEELPAEEREPEQGLHVEPAHRWEQSFPSGGLALERIARDLGPNEIENSPSIATRERTPHWNRDFAWFTKGEIRAAVPSETEVDDELSWPLLAERLARFHLVDNARGQTLPFAKSEVVEARLVARVANIERDPATGAELLELELRGTTRVHSDGTWQLGENPWTPKHELEHGISCELLGWARFDRAGGAFAEFELVALGRFTGRTTMNGRGRAPGPGQVGFHFLITETRIAPTFVAVYDAPWIAEPAVPTWRESPDEVAPARESAR